MKPLSILSDADVFFFYGKNDLEIENESDLVAGIIQPKRSLFYNREDGCGVSSRENFPNSLTLDIGIRYDIVNWSSLRNTRVTDGSEGTVDRRVAISQNTVSFIRDNKGNLDVNVGFIPFADISKPGAVSTNILGSL